MPKKIEIIYMCLFSVNIFGALEFSQENANSATQKKRNYNNHLTVIHNFDLQKIIADYANEWKMRALPCSNRIYKLAISSDGKYISWPEEYLFSMAHNFAGNIPTKIRILDMEKFVPINDINIAKYHPHINNTYPQSNYLNFLEEQGVLHNLDRHENLIGNLVFSPDSKLLISNVGDNIKLWNISKFEFIMSTEHKYPKILQFSDCSQYIAIVSGIEYKKGQTISVYDKHFDIVSEFQAGSGKIIDLDFSNKVIKAFFNDFRFKIWSYDTGSLIQEDTLKVNKQENEKLFKVSPSQNKLISYNYISDKEHAVNITNLTTNSSFSLKLDSQPTDCLFYNQENELIITSSRDKIIYIYSLITKSLIDKLEGHTEFIRQIKLSANGKYLISCSNERDIKIWEPSSYNLLRE